MCVDVKESHVEFERGAREEKRNCECVRDRQFGIIRVLVGERFESLSV